MRVIELKPLRWIASARKDLRAMPEAVQNMFGYALYLVIRARLKSVDEYEARA